MLFKLLIVLTTWFVASTGDDANNCTQAQIAGTPKQTIAAGLACVGAAGGTTGAGHTVEVAAGSYTETQITGLPGGSAGNVFTLKCASHLGCTWNLSGTNFHLNIGSPSTNYVTIRDFVFNGNKTTTPGVGEGGGIAFSASSANTHTHITFMNNEVKNTGRHDGMSITGSSNFTISGNYIHDTGGYVAPEAANNATFHHGIYLSTLADHITIQDNTITDGTGYGVQIYPYGDLVNNNVVRRNTITRHFTAGVVTQGDNNEISANVIYANGTGGSNGGIVGFGATQLIYANTVYGNTGPGLDLMSGAGTQCKNNLVLSNTGTAISGCSTSATNVTSGTVANIFVTPGSDFHLKATAGGTILAVGTDLSATVMVDKDSVPLTATPDIGAYKLITASASVVPRIMDSLARRRRL